MRKVCIVSLAVSLIYITEQGPSKRDLHRDGLILSSLAEFKVNQQVSHVGSKYENHHVMTVKFGEVHIR